MNETPMIAGMCVDRDGLINRSVILDNLPCSDMNAAVYVWRRDVSLRTPDDDEGTP